MSNNCECGKIEHGRHAHDCPTLIAQSRVCEHGRLARQCETCELAGVETELAAAREAVRILAEQVASEIVYILLKYDAKGQVVKFDQVIPVEIKRNPVAVAAVRKAVGQ